MQVGILGVAHMHAVTYAALLGEMSGVQLAVIADEDEVRGRELAARFNSRWEKDYQTALSFPLDAVIVASENSRHREMAMAALEARLPVLCEKPLATRVEDAEAMVAESERRGVVLATAFPMRHSLPIRRLYDYLQTGALGRIVALNGTNRGQNPGGWFIRPELSGGGAVLDHTVHVIDLMRWYTGSEVVEVYAEIGTMHRECPVDDMGLLMLEFENGVVAAHDPSWSRPRQAFPTWGDVTLEVLGTEGVAWVDAFGQRLLAFDETIGKMQYVPWGDNADHGMLQDFLRVVREGGTPAATGKDGLEAVRVALAAYESARAQKPVRLSYNR
ncbi:MAG: Gfo/Idh/MocA family oxidoreductase [Firmicutes bacterium]|nr:Gfo/Idh/MocA family oxidoreductase [Bacillota bacterium]